MKRKIVDSLSRVEYDRGSMTNTKILNVGITNSNKRFRNKEVAIVSQDMFVTIVIRPRIFPL